MDEDEIEAKLQEIYAQNERAFNSTDRAIAEIITIGTRAKELAPHLRLMRRRLERNTKRLCDALNAIKVV